jgi:hypothetical protein
LKLIILEPQKLKVENDTNIRECKITRVDNENLNEKHQQDILWFKFTNLIPPPKYDDCESYLLAILFDAMRENRAIVIKGAISSELLNNLREYQGAWNKWHPELYSIIDIRADIIRNDDTEIYPNNSICAYSGGLDSLFTVWRYSKPNKTPYTPDIAICTIIHGFDIPLSDKQAFNNVYNIAKQTLHDVGIDIISISTNFRQIIRSKWVHTHGAALASALSNFKNIAGSCLIGSTYPYNYLHFPWGSTPILDHLLSSSSFKVIHDGATHTRTEKVIEIESWNEGVKNLRVCWQGPNKDTNCGQCEKCIRTKLNFLAIGNKIPDCFQDKKEISFKGIRLKHEGVIGDWQQIYDFAKSNNIKCQSVDNIPQIIFKNRMQNNVMKFKSYVKNRVKFFEWN